MIDAASKDKPKEDKKPPFMKTEKACDPKIDLKKPTLKKFMLHRKMKKSGGMTSDAQAGNKLAGAPAAAASKDKAAGFKQQSPAAKVKNQDKMQMVKNKPVEKLLGIAPKAPKKAGM